MKINAHLDDGHPARNLCIEFFCEEDQDAPGDYPQTCVEFPMSLNDARQFLGWLRGSQTSPYKNVSISASRTKNILNFRDAISGFMFRLDGEHHIQQLIQALSSTLPLHMGQPADD